MNSLSPELHSIASAAKELYQKSFGGDDDGSRYLTIAPGRVNLIGEHVDYTGGFVFPLAIDYSTVVYGSGKIVENSKDIEISIISALSPDKVEETILMRESKPPEKADGKWKWYVVGVVAQYLEDLQENQGMVLKMAIAGNVPLGGGLSSSASLEVATGRFLECVLGTNTDAKTRALRCQKAENDWCHSPCGIMDQYVSSAGAKGSLLLIDCTSYDFEACQMKQPNTVRLVVTNSNVKHDIAGGEYPVRVAQCKTATDALRKCYGDETLTLRSATLEQVEAAKSDMDDVSYRRAKHVVTENTRTLSAKEALQSGDWKLLGELMNGSHTSMRDDYEVSCEEIDVLVDLAQTYKKEEGVVYGSRLTGGGFGGCTVTLVEQDHVAGLIDHLTLEYKKKTGLDCSCFETSPGDGARLVMTDSS